MGKAKLAAAERISGELGRKVVFDGTLPVDQTGMIDPETGTIRLNSRVGGPENLYNNALQLVQEELDNTEIGGYNVKKGDRARDIWEIGGPDDVIADGSHYVDGKLKPNSTYTTGEPDYLFKTNSDGLNVHTHADSLKLKTHDGRLRHNSYTPGKLQGDHAGHLFADRFGGSPGLDNLVTQAKNVNLSEYKAIENEWAKTLKDGRGVSNVNINIYYNKGSSRPAAFEISYKIDGISHFKKINQ